MQRERLGSRLGFILLSAGCAIGIGNVWKFPYIAGENGGGIFVLIYLFFLLTMGVPVMTMEFAMGRAAQKSPVKLYQEIEPKGSKWHIHGIVSMIGNYVLLMCYTTITGWMVRYFVDTAKGDFVGATKETIETHFGNVQTDLVQMLIYTGVVILLAALVCGIGLQTVLLLLLVLIIPMVRCTL
jgi:NSS family neurotransmitter:Na+ symporter